MEYQTASAKAIESTMQKSQDLEIEARRRHAATFVQEQSATSMEPPADHESNMELLPTSLRDIETGKQEEPQQDDDNSNSQEMKLHQENILCQKIDAQREMLRKQKEREDEKHTMAVQARIKRKERRKNREKWQIALETRPEEPRQQQKKPEDSNFQTEGPPFQTEETQFIPLLITSIRKEKVLSKWILRKELLKDLRKRTGWMKMKRRGMRILRPTISLAVVTDPRKYESEEGIPSELQSQCSLLESDLRQMEESQAQAGELNACQDEFEEILQWREAVPKREEMVRER